MLRPAPEIENLYFIVASGKDLDIQKALADDAVLLKFLHDVTHNSDIKLLKKYVLSEWKSACVDPDTWGDCSLTAS